MSGNIYDLCQDLYDAEWYCNCPMTDPLNLEKGTFRIIKGGAWNLNSGAARVANRGTADKPTNYIGFRMVREL